MFRFLHKQYSFKTDYIVTSINGLAVLFGVIFLNGLIARTAGIEILGEFTYVKRIITSIVGVLLLGINVGLPYYLGREKNNTYVLSAIIIFLFVSIPSSIVIGILIKYQWVPGLTNTRFYAYIIYFIGVISQFLVFALYRGYLRMVVANLLQLTGTAIIPILTFIFIKDIETVLLTIGYTTFSIMSFFVLIKIPIQSTISQINESIKKLISYGLVRIPGFVAQFILLAGLPLLIANEITKSDMAFVNAGISLVRLSLLGVMPLGFVLLPRIADLFAQQKQETLSMHIMLMIKTAILYSSLITIFIYLNTEIIIKLWFNVCTPEAIVIVKYIIIALPFFTITSIVRTPIDAGSTKGYNSWIYSIGAFSFVIGFYLIRYIINLEMESGIVAYVLGHMITTIFGFFIVQKIYQIKILEILSVLLEVICISAILVGVQHLLLIYKISTTYIFIYLLIVLIGSLLIHIYWFKSKWILEVKTLLFTNNNNQSIRCSK